MRRAMATAEVGDDVYGEDPTVRTLEERVAALLGKDSAVFVPSGTMSNQIALLVHTRPGDEVVIADGAHVAWYESGAGAALAGVQFAVATTDVVISPAALEAAIKPVADWNPHTRLVAFENTHNRGGGRILSQKTVIATASLAHSLGLGVHLDGARLANASVASGESLSALAAPADTVSFCLSKGLGAPAGSLLVGDRERIARARRFRKMLGGGMRQAGVLAAAGHYALDHNLDRLSEDHANARAFALALRECPACEVSTPETNIVMIDLGPSLPPASVLSAMARDRGVLLSPFGSRRLRAVTHLDVSPGQVMQAAHSLCALCCQHGP